MKKFFSISYSQAAFNLSMLLLRIAGGALIVYHGFGKLNHFTDMKAKFMNFMGLGVPLSLSLVIFAEFFCGIFIILGLFTRLAAIPLIIAMSVALWKAHHFDVFGDGEKAALFLLIFLVIFLCGPGKASVDGMRR